MTIISIIIEQHAEDKAFNWLLRDSAVHAPHYSLKDIAKLDNRVEAHIDGLRIAGEEGWKIGKEVLAMEEAGEVFTAAVLAFESGDEARIHDVIAAGSVSPELSRGIISALGWLSYQKSACFIKKLLSEQSPVLRRIGIAASAVHRQYPGQALFDALSDSDTLLKARALKAVGELGRNDLISLVRKSLHSEDEKCRFYAAWSAALLGDEASIPVLCDMVKGDSAFAEKACSIALRRMNLSETHQFQSELANRNETKRIAIIGAGVIGDPVSVPWIIQMMGIPELACVAGESFTIITGVDIAYEDLEGEWPEGFEAGPTENTADEDVEMDNDEDLPWPKPELIQNWWKKNSNKFKNGTRYLLGQPITPENLLQVLKNGRQRQRAAAGLKLAIIKPGQPVFEVRAPGFKQKKMLGI
ncbi:MAG: TIGR02270 family protein [Planctomycetia bacterium]|nr:TIGR02270 family protein [Planctomycetia bacterium]